MRHSARTSVPASWPRPRLRRLRSRARVEPMDSEDSALPCMYTSGIDGQAKGDRAHHGRLSESVWRRRTTDIFDLKPEQDAYWCAADIGWITGHSYIVSASACERRNERPSTRARRTSRTGIAGGRSPSATASRSLHRADGHPLAHMKRAPSTADRVTICRSSGCSAPVGRADQPRGVGLVPRAHRQRPDASRRYLAAETARMILITPLPGVTTSSPARRQSRLLGVEAPSPRRTRQRGWPRRWRLPCPSRPWPAMLRGIF